MTLLKTPLALPCALLLLFLASLPTSAAEIGLSVGSIDVFRDQDALEAGFDVTYKPWRWGLKPHFGLHGTTDESFYGYAGLRRPFEVANGRWIWEFSFAVSLYERGNGKELGGPIEFRSGLDLQRRLESGTKIGLGIYHLSNSSIYDLNPGTNSLLLRIVLPRRSKGGP